MSKGYDCGLKMKESLFYSDTVRGRISTGPEDNVGLGSGSNYCVVCRGTIVGETESYRKVQVEYGQRVLSVYKWDSMSVRLISNRFLI